LTGPGVAFDTDAAHPKEFFLKRWQIGKVTVTQVVEMQGANAPQFLFRDLTPQQVQGHTWLRPHFAHADGRLFASLHCFVIESEGRRIVVDTCVGNHKARSLAAWSQLQTPFLARLAEAGFPPDSVDTVLCTHLHVDHVGWNTRWENGAWVPTFPKARYLFGRREWEHWSRAQEGEDRQIMDDSVRPILAAGLAQLVEMDHVLTGEVRLEPTPGHTPGHVSVRLRSEGQEAVITGDLMHHPIQCCRPELASNFDVDADAARATRTRFLREQAGKPVLVLGTHFAAPTGGWVVADGEVWRFAVEPPANRPA
jgi:glyoxylase-like metal-dependent hydrolase (beta-lactamase superfamily II)